MALKAASWLAVCGHHASSIVELQVCLYEQFENVLKNDINVAFGVRYAQRFMVIAAKKCFGLLILLLLTLAES
jgi:hypothetical protein